MSYEAEPPSHLSVSIQLVRDKRLSYRARAIASRLLSNAPGFRMTAVDLARESPAEGRYAVLSAMKELRKFGYAKVIRRQDERGRWHTVTKVYGVPQPECNDCTSDAEVQSPNSGAPNLGEPASGNRAPKSSSNKKKFQEEKTTTAPADLNWAALPQLSKDDQAVVVGIVKKLEPDQQQAALDELAGALRANAIKGQWPGWLHRVVQNFRPNHALTIQSERKRRVETEERAKQQRAEAEARKTRLSDPDAKARGKANLEAIGALLRP